MSKPACFVAKVDPTFAAKLQADLVEQGFSLQKIPYAFFQAKKKGVSCTFYESGKLTVQGKEKDDFIQFYLEPEILGSFTYSYGELSLDLRSRVGSDEAGKGDFFGPLCVACVFASGDDVKKLWDFGVQDSKKMADKKVLDIAKKIKEAVPYHIISLKPKTYNDLYSKFGNLNHMLAWAHATAIQHLIEKVGPQTVIIDQFAHESLMVRALKQKNLVLDLEQRPRAEEDTVVAAASILARASFVLGIEELGTQAQMELPKGASKKVIEAGRKLHGTQGKEALEQYCKTHFTTYQTITSHD
jgi:ribonuclease HIII